MYNIYIIMLEPATILVHIMHVMQRRVYISVSSNLCPHLRAMARALPLVYMIAIGILPHRIL